MAFSVGSEESGGDELGGPTAMAEINIIPLVDVMLVLLIISMVTTPFMEQGVNVELPVAQGQSLQKTEAQQEPVVLFIAKDRSLRLADQSIRLGELSDRLGKVFGPRSTRELFVRADKSVPYGVVADIMTRVQKAGVERVGLVTQPE